MKLVAAALVTLATRAANAQESPEPVTTVDTARWDLAVAVGASNVKTPGAQVGGATMSTSADSSMEMTGLFALRFRFFERIIWALPSLAFAYEGGTRGATEVIPWGGLPGWSIGASSIEGTIAHGTVGGGLAARQWLGPTLVLNATADAVGTFSCIEDRACGSMTCNSWRSPTQWVASASVGAT